MWYRIDYNTALPKEKIWAQTDKFHGQASAFLIDVKNIHYTEPLLKEYVLNSISLENKSKFLDFIYCPECGSSGLIFSEKVRSILTKFNLFQSHFYESIVTKNNEVRKYFFLRIAGDLTHFIDFEKTIFISSKRGGDTREVKCLNNEDYEIKRAEQLEKVDPIRPLIPKEIFLLPAFYELNYDMILLGKLAPIEILINEKLKNALESENLTGIRITHYKKLKN